MNGLSPPMKKRVTLVDPTEAAQPALKKQRISPPARAAAADSDDDEDDEKPELDVKLEVSFDLVLVYSSKRESTQAASEELTRIPSSSCRPSARRPSGASCKSTSDDTRAHKSKLTAWKPSDRNVKLA